MSRIKTFLVKELDNANYFYKNALHMCRNNSYSVLHRIQLKHTCTYTYLLYDTLLMPNLVYICTHTNMLKYCGI